MQAGGRLLPGSISLRFRHGDEFLFFVPETVTPAESRFRSFLEECEATQALTVAQGTIFVSFRFAVIDLSAEQIKKLEAESLDEFAQLLTQRIKDLEMSKCVRVIRESSDLFPEDAKAG